MQPLIRSTLAAVAAFGLIAGPAVAASPEASTVQATSAAQPVQASKQTGVPIVPRARPGTPEDTVARQLMAMELAKAAQSGEKPLVLVSSARLGNTASSHVLFVQIQSARECGSAGCDTVSFRHVNGKWVRIMDTVSGPIRIATTQNKGMRDLIVGHSTKLVWNGTKYA